MRKDQKPQAAKQRTPAPVQQTPNQVFRAWVSSSGRSVDDVAADMGLTAEQVHRLMHGKATITHSTAHRLHRITGMPPEIWIK